MVMSNADATAAMTTLKGCTGSQLFDAMQAAGAYLFSKHLNKANALAAAAADHNRKGYFKILSNTRVASLQAYKALSDRERKHVEGLPRVPKGGKDARLFGAKKNVRVVINDEIGTNEFSNLLNLCIQRPLTVGGLYRAGHDPDNRFLYILPIPAPFIGRSIDVYVHGQDDDDTLTEAQRVNSMKRKDLTHCVVIIVARQGEAPFVMNMFPCDANYVQARTPLA